MVVKMGLRHFGNEGYKQTCVEASQATRGKSTMVLPSTELFHDTSGGMIFVVQPKVLFTARALFRAVRGPTTFNIT